MSDTDRYIINYRLLARTGVGRCSHEVTYFAPRRAGVQ